MTQITLSHKATRRQGNDETKYLHEQRRQLDLFIHQSPQKQIERNLSPTGMICGMTPLLSLDSVFMPTRSTQTQLDFDPVINEKQVTPTSTIRDHYAVPNHRVSATPPTSRTERRTQGQQLFRFEDQPISERTSNPASGHTGTAEERNTRGINHVTQEPGTGTGRRTDHRTDRIPQYLIRDLVPNPNYASPWSEASRSSPVTSTISNGATSTTDEGVSRDVPTTHSRPQSGEKSKARDILTAIRTLKQVESEQRKATAEERVLLQRFGGFGAVALSLFPDPVTGRYKDSSWQALGDELQTLLTTDEYESAKRTTFNAFYTSPIVIEAMQHAIDRLGLPKHGRILEPGCGTGNFLKQLADTKDCIGVELDSITGRITHALYPDQDIRIENFRDTKLGDNSLDGVIGNVPFANIKYEHQGNRFALHDYFFAKSMDALKPGGVMALVTSHFTMDKQNASIREYLAEQADFVGAIRLPAEAFKAEGTKVVTDIVFLKKRAANQVAQHIDDDWLNVGTKDINGKQVIVNQYFLKHPEMVLGDWTLASQLYGDDGFSIKGNGDLKQQLQEAVARLPQHATVVPELFEREPVPARFTRPPPSKHIGEGSFFIGDDRKIYQLEHGASKPVTHGSTILKADGTMMSKRLASLIGLRDAARLVLQAQNESWPESEREATRRTLNLKYDQFVSLYGPINKTTFSETADGNVIRRMPNMVKFRDDPDAMLVMSLEEYDEVTGKAEKAAIFSRDVVGPKHAVTSVRSAEEGLLVSLDEKGGIDLGFIASIYHKPEALIIQELGDLIYLDPATGQYETADIYLSGNVREKLRIAEAAGQAFEANANRLRQVQPPDVLPGDIDAKLGSPWIPASDIQDFAAELFGVDCKNISIAHLKKDAAWSVVPDYIAENSAKAVSEFGTPRANGIYLLELALNMKTPIIYDTIDGPNGEERVMNQDATLAAREKQKEIKERFKNWVFADPERSERLVRIYNDTYNNLRPRLFDGSHLEFPGMNQGISLRPHQKNAIWRVMSSGNTLLAHAVGAGKTFTMAAAGMKMKQAGLIKKPMYVVPNHMLEQFAREFMQLYPNAHLLIASKEDMTKDRRKFLTAKIASGNWDGIIVTHSSFERIGMSKERQQEFLEGQIHDYSELLSEAASNNTSGKRRNIIKTIEKQKANRENLLKELSAEDKKDDGLVFDELGVDHIFIDEAHYFKNLETPTKMERVAGIQTSGSQRAFDIFMKSRYLDQLHPGHGVTFATGTPISNTMVEMYNMQRFLDPKGLIDRGIEHFDAWAANFGEVVDTMEISPDGKSLRPRSRFAKFNNLPELQQMFRSFADVQTADMLNLPRPKLKDGRPITISSPMSDDQSTLQQELVDRYDRIRSTKVDPRQDNALAITTDGRKLAMDARLLKPGCIDDPQSKINELVKNVYQIWKASSSFRGTQLIFSDMGVNATAWGFSPYQDIERKLIASGIPQDQIATIGEAESDAKKQALFEKLRNGTVRILIGSTQKMGTGTNVQRRLLALHHLDAPWKPAEVEQRDGRILRQGNQNEEVAIYRYVTQGSFDAYMWQALETKARFISQIMTGNLNARTAEDIGGQELSYAEVKAIASGNPAVLVLAEADAELQRLNILKKNHCDEQFLIRRKLKELPQHIEKDVQYIHALSEDLNVIQSIDHPEFEIQGQRILSDDLFRALDDALLRIPERTQSIRHFALGKYHGLEFGIQVTPYGSKDVYVKGATTRLADTARDSLGPKAVMNALERIASSYQQRITMTEKDLQLCKQQLTDYRSRKDSVFANDAYMQELRVLRDQLRLSLSSSFSAPNEGQVPLDASAIAEQINALKAQHSQTQHSERTVGTAVILPEESVTGRIRQRLNKPSTSLLLSTSILSNKVRASELIHEV